MLMDFVCCAYSNRFSALPQKNRLVRSFMAIRFQLSTDSPIYRFVIIKSTKYTSNHLLWKGIILYFSNSQFDNDIGRSYHFYTAGFCNLFCFLFNSD